MARATATRCCSPPLSEQLVLLPDELAEDEPVLAQVTSAAVSGLAPPGPERRECEPLRIARSPGASITGALCAVSSVTSLVSPWRPLPPRGSLPLPPGHLPLRLGVANSAPRDSARQTMASLRDSGVRFGRASLRPTVHSA